jgi:hypothetical protein
LCSRGKMPDREHLDRHGNATQCIDKCGAGLVYFEGATYCWGAAECCRSIELTSELDCKAKWDDCYLSNSTCICPPKIVDKS